MDEERMERRQCQSFDRVLIILMFSSLVFGVSKLFFRDSSSHSGLNDLL